MMNRPIVLGLTMLVWVACGDDNGGQTNQNNTNVNDNVSVCGNGTMEPGEQCDDGAANSDSTPNACRTDCRSPYCGDGIPDTGEDCDDGNTANDDGCLTACLGGDDCCMVNQCGDGWLDTTPVGDGSQVEACDDGNVSGGDGCRGDCQQDMTLCGNGMPDQGEICDGGVGVNSDTAPNTCRMSCQIPWCGDGVVDDEYGETCDGSNLAGQDCTTIGLGFTHGVLGCNAAVCALDTSQCEDCVDGDGDGYGAGPACLGTDCDETDITVYQDATELCDQKDNDCDGEVDELWDFNTDNLNCGGCGIVCTDTTNSVRQCILGSCLLDHCLPGYVDSNGMPGDGCEGVCTVTNGGNEACDGVDNDCNGFVDDNCI